MLQTLPQTRHLPPRRLQVRFCPETPFAQAQILQLPHWLDVLFQTLRACSLALLRLRPPALPRFLLSVLSRFQPLLWIRPLPQILRLAAVTMCLRSAARLCPRFWGAPLPKAEAAAASVFLQLL